MNVLKFCIMCFYGTLPNQCVFHEKIMWCLKDNQIWVYEKVMAVYKIGESFFVDLRKSLNLILQLRFWVFSNDVFKKEISSNIKYVTFYILYNSGHPIYLNPLNDFHPLHLGQRSFTISSCYRKLSWVCAFKKSGRNYVINNWAIIPVSLKQL